MEPPAAAAQSTAAQPRSGEPSSTNGLILDGVPDGKGYVPVLEEDAAVPGVDDVPVALDGATGAEGGGGDKPGLAGDVDAVAEDAQHGRRAVELAVAAAEAGIGGEAAPLLTDQRGADEGRGVVRWNAEEDVLDEHVRQFRRRRRHGACFLVRLAWAAAAAAEQGLLLESGCSRAACLVPFDYVKLLGTAVGYGPSYRTSPAQLTLTKSRRVNPNLAAAGADRRPPSCICSPPLPATAPGPQLQAFATGSQGQPLAPSTCYREPRPAPLSATRSRTVKPALPSWCSDSAPTVVHAAGRRTHPVRDGCSSQADLAFMAVPQMDRRWINARLFSKAHLDGVNEFMAVPGVDDVEFACDRVTGAEGGGGDEPSLVIGGVVDVAEDS
ncbi:hypothetical protein EJB05_14038, partial [Eragrostis curvula]